MKKKYYQILKLFSFVLIINLIPAESHSQTFEWIRSQSVNYNHNPDMLNYVVAVDEESDVIYSGMDNYTLYYSQMFGDLFLKKYTSDGDEIFNIQIEGNGIVEQLEARDGKYYLTGKFKDSLYFQGQPQLYTSDTGSEYFLAIFDNFGSAISVINLSDLFPGISDLSIFTLDDNNNLYMGMSVGTGSQICKIDGTGNVMQTIEQTDVWLINNIDFDPYGNMVVSGAFANTESYFGGELYEVSTQDNMYVAKYNSQGLVQWVTFIVDVIYTSHNQIKCDNSGNIYFAGFLFGPVEFGPFQANGPNWVFDFFLTKINENGEFQWLVEVPDGEITGDATVGKLNFMEVDQDNNVYVSGFIRDTIDWGNGVISTGDNYYDLLLLQFSPEGIIQWSKSGGSESFVKSVDLAVDAEGNCYMAAVGGGEMAFDTITHFQEGFVYPFLIKLDQSLNVNIDSHDNMDQNIDIYPNPAADFINISSENEISEINIYNQSGHLVFNGSVNSTQFQYRASGLKAGIYFFRIETVDGAFTKQIIIE